LDSKNIFRGRFKKIKALKNIIRKSDQKVFISDNSKANKLLNWEPKIDKYTGVKNMVKWIDRMEEAQK